MVVSTIAVFVFLFAVYYLLTNVEHSFLDVLPGTIVAAVLLEASFQVLPIYVRYSNNVVALKAFGGPALLLVWLYVMANVIVFGAEVNWRYAQKHHRPDGRRAGGSRARLERRTVTVTVTVPGGRRRLGRGASCGTSSRCRARPRFRPLPPG